MEAVQGHFTPQREQLGSGEEAQTLAPSLRCEAKPTDPRHGLGGLPPHLAPQILGVEGSPGLGKGLGQLQGTCPGRRGERALPLPVLWCLRALLTRPPGGSGGKWLRMSQEGGIVGGGWAV